MTSTTRRTSILLNNIPSSSSSSASDVGDFDSSSSNSTQQRQQPRIRFAPLPDPRRDDITTPPPLPPDTHPMSRLDDSPNLSPSSSLSSPAPSTISPASTISPTPPPNPHSQPRSHSPSCDSKRSWKTKNLLKPLLRRSASPFPPSPHFNISTEDILTLGTLHLFRARSGSANADNESVHSTASSDGEHSRYGGWGGSLARFTSTNSTNSTKSAPTRQVPPLDTGSLSRTQSASDFASFSHPPSRTGRPRSRSDDPSPARNHLSAPTSPAHRTSPLPSPTTSKTGTRLLNGRVYGARRHEREQRNLFLSAKDAEPEFVEWGYGGMGSVAASRGKVGEVEARYGRLQRAGVVLGGGEDAEEDDGGGVSWVKRRREKREREAKEKAEREKAEAASPETNGGQINDDSEQQKAKEKDTDAPGSLAVQAASVEDTANTSELPTPPGPTLFPPVLSTTSSSATIPIPHAAAPSHTPTRTPGESTPTSRPSGEHHVLTTTLPPALAHSHSHSHSHQRTMSRTGSAVNLNLRDGQVDVRAKSEGENGDAKTGDAADEKPAKTEAGAKVEAKVDVENSEDDDDDGDEDSDSSEREADSEADSDDDEEEEEDSTATEAARRTALGAGVEKVSRHKEENPKSAGEGATATSPVAASPTLAHAPGEGR